MKNILKNPNQYSNKTIIPCFIIIIVSLIYLIFYDGFGTTISYVLYLIMTYSLIIICVKMYWIIKNKINRYIDNNKYLKRYRNDHKLRYKISLIVSLFFNVIYALFKLIMGIYYKSIWFITFAIYYLLLIIIRTNIINEELKSTDDLRGEYFKYRNTGIILLLVNVILTMIILIIVNQKIIIIYPNYLAITVATYTFYLIITSIYSLIKYRKYKSPLISSSKILNVVTSLVSLISLEMILIPTFGNNNTEFFEIMIMATGGGIALIIIAISLYMIMTATDYLNKNDNITKFQ